MREGRLRLVVVFAIGDDDNDRCSAWEGTDVSYAKLDNTDAAVVSHLVVAVGRGGDSKLRRLPGAAVRRGGIAHSPDCWMPMP